MKFKGKIVIGRGVGGEFGVPTLNLELEKKINLEEGVYFVSVREYGYGVMHFGHRKTFDDKFSIEIYILDYFGNLQNKMLDVEVFKKTRETEKFEDEKKLYAQIQKDIIKAKKYFLRKEILNKWKKIKGINLDVMSKEVNKKCVQDEVFVSSENIFVYAPMHTEVPFVKKMCETFPDKKYFFPRIEGNKMSFYESSFSDLKKGEFGILEPDSGDPIIPKIDDFMFVPAVAVDKKGNRLGRGRGYYDRFLATISCYTVCVVPELAVVRIVPVESHDVKVDEVWNV